MGGGEYLRAGGVTIDHREPSRPQRGNAFSIGLTALVADVFTVAAGADVAPNDALIAAGYGADDMAVMGRDAVD